MGAGGETLVTHGTHGSLVADDVAVVVRKIMNDLI